MKISAKTIRRKTVRVLSYPVLAIIILALQVIPITWTRRFSLFVGKQVYLNSHKTRKRTLANLEDVYGDKMSEEERIDMARKVFVEIVMSFMDYIAYSRLTNKTRFFSLIEVVGQEYLQAAYERGKGVICLIPHMSSWEFAAITPPMLGYETSAASAALKIKRIQNMMIKFRARRGMKNITRDGSYEKLVEVLRKGECLILMIDQDTKVKSVFVDFMGKSAYTPTGASRLALETGAAVVPMAMTRKEDGNYRFIIQPELPLISTGNPESDIYENTRIQTKSIESIIRTYPAQWVWMHDRWRTTPEMVEEYRRSKNK
ncbi:lysophospholipid acyltransferase family protein [Bacteroidales bacterium OttesenSCG-928-A17]|nr:lysophospholipid acyltransferase family protein [Bacteroidales bacterium OttesenSCG-928-A17]